MLSSVGLHGYVVNQNIVHETRGDNQLFQMMKSADLLLSDTNQIHLLVCNTAGERKCERSDRRKFSEDKPHSDCFGLNEILQSNRKCAKHVRQDLVLNFQKGGNDIQTEQWLVIGNITVSFLFFPTLLLP